MNVAPSTRIDSTFSRSNEPTNEPSTSLSFSQRPRRRLVRDQYGGRRPRARRITLARVVRPRWAVGTGRFSFLFCFFVSCAVQSRRAPGENWPPESRCSPTTGIKTAASRAARLEEEWWTTNRRRRRWEKNAWCRVMSVLITLR